MTLRRLTVAAALAVALVVVAGAAGAATGFTLQESGSALFPDRTYVITLDGKQQLTTADVKATENGRPVQDPTVQSAASEGGIGTVLLIDASNSMKGSIDDAMAAARTFASKNPGQPLSVITFNSVPTVVLPFTTDPKAVKAALAKAPPLAEGTKMFDALGAAAAQVRGAGIGAGRIVLLSDGDDVGSVTTRESAIGQLQTEGITAYTVGIESAAFTADDLKAIAEQTGGTYAGAASAAELDAIYEELGFKLGNEYLLRYRSDARPDQEVKLEVAIAGIGETQSVTYTTPNVGNSAPFEKSLADRILQSRLLMVAVITLVLALLWWFIRSLLTLGSNRRLRARLGEFVTLPEEQQAAERREEVTAVLAPTGEERRFRNWTWFKGFSEDVDVGGTGTSPQTLLWMALGLGLVGLVLGGVILGPVGTLMALLPILVINFEVRRRASKVRNAFAEQLPDNLEVLGSALRSGHSLVGAMGVLVEQAAEPSQSEFRRVLRDEQLGIQLDEALEVAAQRMRNRDLDQLAMLALLQREAGGNMAEVLDQVVENIRARMDLRRLVRVLTSQGRMARWIICMIPLVLMVFIAMVNPSHLDPLFHDPRGQFGLVMAVLCTMLGFWVIKKLVDIEL